MVALSTIPSARPGLAGTEQRSLNGAQPRRRKAGCTLSDGLESCRDQLPLFACGLNHYVLGHGFVRGGDDL